MLVHHLQGWPKINPILGKPLVFAGKLALPLEETKVYVTCRDPQDQEVGEKMFRFVKLNAKYY